MSRRALLLGVLGELGEEVLWTSLAISYLSSAGVVKESLPTHPIRRWGFDHTRSETAGAHRITGYGHKAAFDCCSRTIRGVLPFVQCLVQSRKFSTWWVLLDRSTAAAKRPDDTITKGAKIKPDRQVYGSETETT